jgi:hypothetical protein
MLLIDLPDMKRTYQPACLERIFEWTSGVRRHGCGKLPTALFEGAIELEITIGLPRLERNSRC